MRVFKWLVFGAVVILAAYSLTASMAQEDMQYFAQTGHFVQGAFLVEYLRVQDPAFLYGAPITEQFVTTAEGAPTGIVQYFERARFEQKPDGAFTLTLLGVYLLEQENPEPWPPAPATAPCELFGSEYRVCYEFLDYYKTHGGVAQFGYPITEIVSRKGIMAQYFQRAIFEWRFELGAEDAFQLVNIGELWFDQNEDTRLKIPLPPPE